MSHAKLSLQCEHIKPSLCVEFNMLESLLYGQTLLNHKDVIINMPQIWNTKFINYNLIVDIPVYTYEQKKV